MLVVRVRCRGVMADTRHTPGAEAPLSTAAEKPKAKALGYLEASMGQEGGSGGLRPTLRGAKDGAPERRWRPIPGLKGETWGTQTLVSGRRPG
jgi:hypothetical protein